MAYEKQLIDPGQHNNLTRGDMKRLEASGLRYDNLIKNYEIWVLGKLVREVSAQEILINPAAHIEVFAEVFGMDPSTLIFPTGQA